MKNLACHEVAEGICTTFSLRETPKYHAIQPREPDSSGYLHFTSTWLPEVSIAVKTPEVVEITSGQLEVHSCYDLTAISLTIAA